MTDSGRGLPQAPRASRLAVIIIATVGLLLVASQWRAIHTQNVNWDEFALLGRASDSLRTGKLVGGGRPGLTTLLLTPFVQNCTDSVAAITQARALWLGFTLLYLGGVLALVRLASGRRRNAWLDGCVAVALLALVPAFLRWSVQVRTDQPALMLAVWGGVLLLASSRRAFLAAPAGLLVGLGYLCSQKALYVVPLLLILFVLRATEDREPRAGQWRRAVTATVIAILTSLVAVWLYGFLIARFYSLPSVASVAGELSTFAYYRAVFGFRAYVAMAPSLLPHMALIALLVIALFTRAGSVREHRAPLFAALAVLGLGAVVGAVHGGAFPYFWMTLGLFPAVAIGLAWPVLPGAFTAPGGRSVLLAAFVLLGISAARAGIELGDDTQRVQRDAMTFIAADLPGSARGFQVEGALFCRKDPDPFPAYFADTAASRLSGPSGRQRAEDFVQEFRSRPVTFMIAHRLFQFPEPIQSFWDTHYVLYRDEVMLAGRTVDGTRGTTFTFDVVVPARYRWMVQTGSVARLSDGPRTLGDGSEIDLSAGAHTFTLLDDVSGGLLALAVPERPRSDGPPFYDPAMVRELDPLYPRK